MSDLALEHPMLKIGFIGASKTGTVLATYFQSKNLILSGFYSRNHNALQETTLQLQCEKFTNINTFTIEGNDKKLYQNLSSNLPSTFSLDTINYEELTQALGTGK